MYQKGLSMVAEMEFLKTSCRKCLLMNELDCVEWNGAGSNIRKLPELTVVYLTEELVNWIAHLGHAWQTSVSNNKPRHKAMHCLTKLRPITALRASLCTCAHGQATKRMNSSWSFWTLQNGVRSLQRQNNIIPMFYIVQQRCKHLSCLLLTSNLYNNLSVLYTYICLLYEQSNHTPRCL